MRFSVERCFNHRARKCLYRVLVPRSEITEEEWRSTSRLPCFPLDKIGQYEEHILFGILVALRPHLKRKHEFITIERTIAERAFPEVQGFNYPLYWGRPQLPVNWRLVPEEHHSEAVRMVEFDVPTS
jgi:hypothetical protein